MTKERDAAGLIEKSRQLVAGLEGSMSVIKRAEDRARQLLASARQRRFCRNHRTGTQDQQFELVPRMMTIRSVTNAPGIIHVCQAADLARTDYLSIARYSGAIRSELAAGDLARGADENDRIAFLIDPRGGEDE